MILNGPGYNGKHSYHTRSPKYETKRFLFVFMDILSISATILCFDIQLLTRNSPLFSFFFVGFELNRFLHHTYTQRADERTNHRDGKMRGNTEILTMIEFTKNVT